MDRDHMASRQHQHQHHHHHHHHQRRKKRHLVQGDAGMKEEEGEETMEHTKRQGHVKEEEEEEQELRLTGQQELQDRQDKQAIRSRAPSSPPACLPQATRRKKITACARCRVSKTRYE